MTARIEKTVFISYRRTNLPWALFIYQNLKNHGFDVFFDFQSIDSGDFERVILNNIKARAHFIVVLTPSALERCKTPNDWLRREIETAIEERRNIVPLLVEGFDFGNPAVRKALTGKLSALGDYNGLPVPAEYALEAMDRLRERYLNVPLEGILHPIPKDVQLVVDQQRGEANKAAQVEIKELTAQESFERGLQTQENQERVKYFTDAIRNMPNHAESYYNRGLARNSVNDKSGAIRDYTEAIRLQPNYAEVYYERGLAYKDTGSIDLAIQDFTEAVRLKPDLTYAYLNRGIALLKDKQLDSAIRDFGKVIHLQPNLADAYYNRGVANEKKGLFDAALRDFTKAIHLKPDFAKFYEDRAEIWRAKGDHHSAEADLKKFLDLGGVKEKSTVEKIMETGVKATAAYAVTSAVVTCAYMLFALLLMVGIVWLIIRIFWHG